MKETPNESVVIDTTEKPVAYDTEGRPLYAAPQTASAAPQPAPQPAVVHVARSVEPTAQVISPEVQRLNERSRRLYPDLDISAGEYIISAVHRHPIGVIAPLAVGTLVIGLVLSVFFNYEAFVETLSIRGVFASASTIALPVWIFVAVIVLGMVISYYVYSRNRFFLTNESVIQEIQTSLFSRQEQTVSLGNIEDASFTQKGIMQQIFNYGDIRLSTEGDETTYRFSYVARPKEHIARLNNAVEAFKNGRPVSDK